MGKRHHLLILLATGLFLASCQRQPTPVTPTLSLPADTPKPFPTSTPGPFTISGEFVLTNTSPPGMEVGVETMTVVLEYRLSITDQWEKILTDCSFDPPAPLVLREELVVQYECTYLQQPPPNAALHTTAEVRIHGSNEVFRMEVNSP
jgi:hypothetical protein